MSEIPLGIHTGKVGNVEFKSFGQKNTPALEVTVRLPEGEVRPLIWLTDKAKDMAKKQLKLCGFNVEERPLDDLWDAPGLLAGNDVDVRVYEEEWQGNFRQKADIHIPSVRKGDVVNLGTELFGSPKGKRHDPDAARKAAEAMGETDLPF